MKFVFVATLALASLCLAADNPPVVVDQIVAKVNGDIVSQDELQRAVQDMTQELKAQGASAAQIETEIQSHQKDVLRDRIDELLLIERGKELNINVDSDVSKYMANLQRQSKITDTEKFHEFVRQQSGRRDRKAHV